MSEIEEFLSLPIETQRRQLKEQLFKTVPEGEVKETAHAVHIEAYTLYKMRDGENEKYNLIRPELINIMHHRRDLRVLDFLDGLFGRVAFTIPQPLESFEEISRHITQVFRETSLACQTIIESADSGSPGGAEITREEFKAVQEEIRKAHQQLAALEEAARRKSQQHSSWPVRLVARVTGRAAK
ncbi:MAG: phage regulatory CII family protein [Candidatus Micrarchaeia archaeon]|jgi:hypothetical protein